MSEIRVKENESLESALRRFKRSCAKEGVIAEVKKREHYVSPSLKRKQKSEAARKNKRSRCCYTGFQNHTNIHPYRHKMLHSN